MIKLLAITLTAVSLAACGSMNRDSARMGNAAETKNSTDANKSANPAAVSPAPAAGTGSGSGSGVGGSAAPGTR
jgi:hypothetical protein